jgi:hypothetical protein
LVGRREEGGGSGGVVAGRFAGGVEAGAAAEDAAGIAGVVPVVAEQGARPAEERAAGIADEGGKAAEAAQLATGGDRCIAIAAGVHECHCTMDGG